MNMMPSRLRDVDLLFDAPPSKSYTHRALIAASLAQGESRIEHPLQAEDTRHTLQALEQMGILTVRCRSDRLTIEGCNGSPRCPEGIPLSLGNSGTSLRLLTSVALLCPGPVTLTGSPRMLERPIGPLVSSLNALGGEITYLGETGYPPLQVSGQMKGGCTQIDGTISSQFISSVLMVAPYAEDDVEIRLLRLPASRSYLDITIDVMQAFGADVSRDGYTQFEVAGGRGYRGRDYTIEGDYSSASYLFAIAAACGGRVSVRRLHPGSVQGDRQFLTALESMGCRVSSSAETVTVERSGDLEGIEADMSSSPDTVQTLCVVAALARSPTTISGISHLRYKESDRVRITAEYLRMLGSDVRIDDNSLTIIPAPLHGGVIDPYDDHRTAMSFAVLGLAIGGITIQNAECVAKSYPGFWKALQGAET
jgi:3-phosphoshikimate 1-carboxyvinyltransferase